MSHRNCCLAVPAFLVLALVVAAPQAVAQTSYTWTGTTSNVWDPNSSDQNWVAGGLLSTYSDGSNVTFDDTAAGNYSPIMIAAGGVQPLSVVFNNNVLAYSFSGGAIGGPATVAVNGSAGVTFYNVNTYTGATTIGGGTLTLANANALQDSTATLTVPGGLAFAPPSGASMWADWPAAATSC